MNLPDALKVLGHEVGGDPRPRLADFKDAREHIAGMVRDARHDALAEHYQKKLIKFDQALAAVQEHLEASGLAVPSLPSPPVAGPKSPASPKPLPHQPAGRSLSYLVCILTLLTLLAGAGGGGWIYFKNEQSKQELRLIKIADLERQGSILIENRRWQGAADVFSKIDRISPGSDLAKRGHRDIQTGMMEEQTQFVGYWSGQAIAELESGHLEEANTAARKILEKFPAEKEAATILDRIAAARISQSRAAIIANASAALDQRKWSLAISTVQPVLTIAPEDPDAKSILADATAALEKSAADHAKAMDLLQLALARDQGRFDQQALDWLREASSLAPENPEITARLEKLSNYSRTLRVPGDFATPQEALANALDRDRVVLGAATWKGPLVINAAVELQGAGLAETRVECSPENGSAITIGPNARGARISGITFRHDSFAPGTERYSVALVRGGIATFADCRFTEASGHGLAVIEGGQATVSRSHFTDNGWNGIAAIGKGSTLDIRDSESLNNFEHGIESWDSAAVILINNRCEGNSRNGIHTDNGPASATIEGNQLIANREFGLVLKSAASGKISGNTARANLLGGLVIHSGTANLPITSNQVTLNQGPGLVLERGLVPTSYSSNSVSMNTGQQILAAADLVTPTAPAEPPPRATIVPEP